MHAQDNLDVKSLLIDAKDECRALLDDNKWPAAMNVKDNKALNSNCGSVNQAATKDLKTSVNTLVQQQNNRDKSNDTCDHCGEKGHWANNCPKLSGNKKFNPKAREE